MKKVLILTAGYGEGHNTAARNVRDALVFTAPGEVEAEVVDLFETCYGIFDAWSKKAYLAAINDAPWLWQKIYGFIDSTRVIENTLPLLSGARHALAELLVRHRPDVVISTYPIYNYLLDQIFRGEKKPFAQLTVVTDSISINSVWYRCASDVFLLANEETATVLRAAGVENIRVLGFPVTHRFETEKIQRLPPSPTQRPRVFYMINFGRKNAPVLVRELLQIAEIDLTVSVGRDESLRKAVEQAAVESSRSIEIVGWTDRLPNILMEHHLLISKAGGATVQEAIAAKTPMIISQVVPGQEEGNAELIAKNNCGAHAETNAAICDTVRRAFAADAALWRTWSENIARLSQPDAALKIARFVMERQ